MTTISILNGDFQIEFEDEGTAPGLRKISRTSGASNTVYTTNQLYSAVADAADDFVAMGFRNPMLPTTPNAYTMENQYFIPRSSTQYLKEGSITADYSLTASPDTNGNGILKVEYLVSGGTDFDAADIGTLVTSSNGDADTGILLDFDTDQDGTKCAWIRPVDSTPATGDIFDGVTLPSTKPTLTTPGGASVTQVANGVSGDHIFSAIQAIGSVPTATEVYVVQNRRKVQRWDTDGSNDPDVGNYLWWTTDPTASLGIISILMQVKDSGNFIADGDLEVFARRYTSLYDNFRLRVQAGGFSALPLAAAADINNTTGYRSMILSGSTGTWDVGNGIYQDGANWAEADVKGVITAVTNPGATPTIEYYLVGNHGLATDGTGNYINDFINAVVTEYDFSTAADGDAAATGVGTLPSANSGGPTDTAASEGGTVTIELGGFSVDHTGANGNEDYSVQVDCQSNVPIAKVYERLKYVTRRGANEEELFGVGTQATQAGLQYGPVFDGSNAASVDLTDDEINLTGHEYAAGDKVIYDAGGGTQITGLTDGATYFVGPGTVGAAADTIHIYNTYSDALYYENRINLTGLGVGTTHYLRKVTNVPGETYRGLDGQFEYDASTGTLREGENIFTTTGGSTWTGRLLHQNTTGTGEGNPGSDTYITTTDSQTSIDTLADNDVVEDAFGTDDVTLHSAGSLGFATFTSPKSSPFGTFTGTQIFGARGVSFINFDGADVQAYILTDDYGNLRNPPNTVSFTVTNTAALDRVLVARDTGVDGIIDKDQFGGMTATSQGATSIVVNSSPGLDPEVPQAGYLRVVDTTPALPDATEAQQEHHYEYSSRDIATDTFTLFSIPTGTVTAGSNGSVTVLEDTGAGDFINDGVKPGMLVRNTTDTVNDPIFEIVSVDSATSCTITPIHGTTTARTWATGNGYEINRVITAYTTSDDIYDLIIDAEATTTSISNSFTQSTNFDVVVNVRQGKVILPFTVNQAVSSSNVTVTTVRQPDNIAT